MCEERKNERSARWEEWLATAQFREMFSQADGEPLSPMSCWEGPACSLILLHAVIVWKPNGISAVHPKAAPGPLVNCAPSSRRSEAHFHYCHPGIKILIVISQIKFSFNSQGFATTGNSKWMPTGVWRQFWKKYPKSILNLWIPGGSPRMTEQVMHYTRPFGQGIWDPAPVCSLGCMPGKAAFPREVTHSYLH